MKYTKMLTIPLLFTIILLATGVSSAESLTQNNYGVTFGGSNYGQISNYNASVNPSTPNPTVEINVTGEGVIFVIVTITLVFCICVGILIFLKLHSSNSGGLTLSFLNNNKIDTSRKGNTTKQDQRRGA